MPRVARILLLATAAGAAVVCSNPSGPSGSAVALNGVYRLRVETQCEAIPPSERTQEYVASISGTSGTLSGATFWTHPNNGLLNRFVPSATTTGWRLNFTSANYGVIERTSPGTYLEISGNVTGTRERHFGASSTLTGSLTGSIRYGQDLRKNGSFVTCGTANLTLDREDLSAPPAEADPVITSITIAGPGEIAPKESVQLQLMARYSDNATREIKEGVTWRTSSSTIVTVSPTGVITGGQNGSANITASVERPNIGSLSVGRETFTLPTGTFRLSGKVTESGAPDFPVSGASVVVEAGGAATGISTTTDFGGLYQIFGLAGPTRIRISRDGYQPFVSELTMSSHQTLNGELLLVEPRRNVGSLRELTVTAADSCAAVLPEAMRRRTFGTSIQQFGANITVTLTGATFSPPQQNRFAGRIQGTTIQLFIGGSGNYYGYYYYPAVLEQVSTSSFYSFDGLPTLTQSGDTFAGMLNGRVLHLERASATRYNIVATCQSAGHRIELR